MTDACCAAGTLVFKQDTPEAGAVQTLGGDLEAYVVGAGTTALILGTDIFGFAAPNTRANADMMAAALGCMVVVPDHFRGTDIKKYLDGAEFTPAAIGGFLAKHGTVEATKADLLDKVVPFAAAAGAMRFLYMGFCWGGKIALALVADEQLAPKFAAAGGLHASLKGPRRRRAEGRRRKGAAHAAAGGKRRRRAAGARGAAGGAARRQAPGAHVLRHGARVGRRARRSLRPSRRRGGEERAADQRGLLLMGALR